MSTIAEQFAQRLTDLIDDMRDARIEDFTGFEKILPNLHFVMFEDGSVSNEYLVATPREWESTATAVLNASLNS